MKICLALGRWLRSFILRSNGNETFPGAASKPLSSLLRPGQGLDFAPPRVDTGDYNDPDSNSQNVELGSHRGGGKELEKFASAFPTRERKLYVVSVEERGGR